MILVNTIIVSHIGGPDGVAVYQGGLRFWNLTLLPLFGIASALTTVIGAAWGAQNRRKIKEAFKFALRITLLLEGALMGLTFFAAPLITKIYTWSKEASRLSYDFKMFFRIIVTINIAAVIIFYSRIFVCRDRTGTKKAVPYIFKECVFCGSINIVIGHFTRFWPHWCLDWNIYR